MINSLQQWPFWRDTWGDYDAAVIPRLAPLDHNSCYRPKYYNAPDIGNQLIEPGGYRRYTVTISPGSLIYGWFVNGVVPRFVFQLTDIATGHQFWDQPISSVFLGNPNSLTDAQGVRQTYPNLLCYPYPVVGDGRFKAEIWADKTNEISRRCVVIIGVAEVYQCES